MFGVYRTDAAEGSEPFETYGSGAEAGARASALNAAARAAERVERYRVKPITTEEWKQRERDRFWSGEYEPMPKGWKLYNSPDTFPHPSKSEPGKLAYTPSVEYGVQDRQIRSTPGSYLAKFFPIMAPEQIQRLALQFAGKYEAIDLKLATEPDDIVRVYKDGPNSCMSHDAGVFDGHLHPCYVYGAGELAVAYLEPNGIINARALCWPDEAVYGTIYGDIARMRSALETAGYRNGSLSGARILKIENENGNGYIMPYIDGYYSVEDCGDHFTIDGSVPADNTEGTTIAGRLCCECGSHIDEDEMYHLADREDYACGDCAYHCEDCGEMHAAGSMREGESICSWCHDRNYTECEDCNVSVRDEEIMHTEDGTVCPDCMEESFGGCEDCCETYRYDNMVERGDNGAMYCECCAEQYDEDNEDEEAEDEAEVSFA